MTNNNDIKRLAAVLKSAREADKPANTFEDALERALAKVGKLPKKNAQAEARLQRAIAEHYPRATMQLNIAKAERIDPLSLELEMVLLPLDKPNANKQLVPSSEANNIINSARNKPIRANFNGVSVAGHANTKDIGVISSAYVDKGVIYATGTVWTERNEDLEAYLLGKGMHGGSFEIYYARSEKRNDIEVLFDTVFAAYAVVKNPAYGTDTPIRVKQ